MILLIDEKKVAFFFFFFFFFGQRFSFFFLCTTDTQEKKSPKAPHYIRTALLFTSLVLSLKINEMTDNTNEIATTDHQPPRVRQCVFVLSLSLSLCFFLSSSFVFF